MGWSTVTWRGSVMDTLRHEYRALPWVASNRVTRGGVIQVYAALRFPFPMGFPGMPVEGPVRAVVFLVELDGSGPATRMAVKVIHECEGPFYHGASRRVLDALDPTDDAGAVAWRAKCRAVLSLPRLVVGSEVLFDPPITAGGCPISRAVFQGRGVFVSVGADPFHFRVGREFLSHLRESGRMGRVIA